MPIVNVRKHVLSKVIEYLMHHVESPPKEIAKVCLCALQRVPGYLRMVISL